MSLAPMLRGFLVLSSTLIAFSCVEPAAAVEPINSTFFGDVALKGYDPVAYFTEGKPVKGSKEFSFEYHGANWRFANQENLDRFRENPEKYAPQYGGYCAWAVAHGDTADIDPKAFKIVDDKLYLNYNQEIQKDWEKDIPGFIEKADKAWPELRDKDN